MKLKKSHAKDVAAASYMLRQVANNTENGKPLDQLRKRIDGLEELELWILEVTSQGYLDFNKIETISKKNKKTGKNQSRQTEVLNEKPENQSRQNRVFVDLKPQN